jgi:hypothetical protein
VSCSHDRQRQSFGVCFAFAYSINIRRIQSRQGGPGWHGDGGARRRTRRTRRRRRFRFRLTHLALIFEASKLTAKSPRQEARRTSAQRRDPPTILARAHLHLHSRLRGLRRAGACSRASVAAVSVKTVNSSSGRSTRLLPPLSMSTRSWSCSWSRACASPPSLSYGGSASSSMRSIATQALACMVPRMPNNVCCPSSVSMFVRVCSGHSTASGTHLVVRMSRRPTCAPRAPPPVSSIFVRV